MNRISRQFRHLTKQKKAQTIIIKQVKLQKMQNAHAEAGRNINSAAGKICLNNSKFILNNKDLMKLISKNRKKYFFTGNICPSYMEKIV